MRFEFNKPRRPAFSNLATLAEALLPAVGVAHAPESEDWNAKFQASYVRQENLPFAAADSGPNSLSTDKEDSYSCTASAAPDFRLWDGGEFDGGGEASQAEPLRKLTGMGSQQEAVESEANQPGRDCGRAPPVADSIMQTREHNRPKLAEHALELLAVGLCLSWFCYPSVAMAVEPAASTLPFVDVPSASHNAGAESSPVETWSLHGQMTNVTQWHPAFTAPYSGANSLDPGRRSAETTDLTLFLGLRPWRGGELYLNPEYDQGFGLSNTLGVAGYPSGEAYKVGANKPYFRLPRAFFRQVIGLGGDQQKIEAGANQLAGSMAADNVVVTLGKFSVVDIFDSNAYAHDPRADFLNWSVIDAGAFDYADDAWGFTYGMAVEWSQSWWTLRGGFFDISDVPNSQRLDKNFNQFEWVGEWEARHQWLGHPGKVKFLVYENRGHMGDYSDAVRLGQQTGAAPDTALVRHFASHPGAAINLEQEVAADLGIFARASLNDGSKEAYEFTEINRSISLGLSLKGERWGRHDDSVGVAVVVNGLSGDARGYFAAGGMGILIGDGQLNYGPEKIAELYYAWQAERHLALGLDCQYVVNPAYNRDRGPVHFLGLRVHAEF